MMRRLIGLGLLVPGWLLLFLTLTILTEFILVPWDTAIERPEVGTWQRTLNDFFETSPGQWSISVPLTGLSILAGVGVLRRKPEAGWRLAVVNLICVAVLWGAFLLAAMLNNWLHPYPPVLYDPTYHGYYRSIVPGLAVLGVCALWLLWQRRATAQASRHPASP